MSDDWEIDAPELNRRVLAELIEVGGIDCERLVQVAQLMMLPEFDSFFTALCRIDIGDALPVATALAQCAQGHAQKDVPV